MNEEGFDLTERLDELRCHSTEWLRTRRDELVRNQRRLKVEELAVTKVLDERGLAGDPAWDVSSRDQISTRTAREDLTVARALEALPAIAEQAHAGNLSWDQLRPTVEVADAGTDAEWARRAPGFAPADLARLARQQRVVTAEDAAARREAREFRMFWRKDAGMSSVRGELPDVDGALAESVFERMIDRMRPEKGEPWQARRHRMADAFTDLCRNYADAEPTGQSRPHVIFQVPLEGSPEVNGVPVAIETLEAVLDKAVVHQQVIDADTGALCTDADLDQDSIPADVRRLVLARDRHCRVPGCENTWRLQIHHMNPRCRRGNHDPDKLAAVCPQHHPMLEPHGPYQLVGDPNRPDGLRRVRVDELPDARAGPDANVA